MAARVAACSLGSNVVEFDISPWRRISCSMLAFPRTRSEYVTTRAVLRIPDYGSRRCAKYRIALLNKYRAA